MINYNDFFNINDIANEGMEPCYMVPPMLINKIPAGKESKFSEICSSGEYMGSIKKDGASYIYERTENYGYLFGRTVSKKNGLLTHKEDNVPHIISALSVLPAQTILVGEIYYPGGESKDVTSIMGCLPNKAIERQKTRGLIHYYLHDILMYDGKDVSSTAAETRYNLLETIYKKHNLGSYDFMELAECETTNLDKYIHQALDSGEEGVVLRKRDEAYYPGKRPAWVTLKFKQHDTADAICMGFEEPTKEYYGKELDTWVFFEGDIPVTKPYYYGWKSSMIIGCYNDKGILTKIGTVSSGLTEELQEAFGKEPDKYIGKVVELECMSKNNKDHTLRHPYFVRFREDKDADNCTFNEVFK